VTASTEALSVASATRRARFLRLVRGVFMIFLSAALCLSDKRFAGTLSAIHPVRKVLYFGIRHGTVSDHSWEASCLVGLLPKGSPESR